MNTYVAVNENNQGFICEAKSKAEMKKKGMNMRLDWQKENDYKSAKQGLLASGVEIKNETVLSR